MIHTIEISKMIPETIFNEVLLQNTFEYRRKNKIWISNKYKDSGIITACLFKFKPSQTQFHPKDSYLYMISLTIAPSAMCDADYHSATNTLSFAMPVIIGIYRLIYDCFPMLETNPNNYLKNNELWMRENTFLVRRIDFAIQIKEYANIYLRLIDRGFILRSKNYHKKCYNHIHDTESILTDNDPDVSYDNLEVDVDTVYYSGKSANVNIYHKLSELTSRNLPYDNNIDYDFLRLEVQIKKNKLNYLIKKHRIRSRELQDILVPESASVLEEDTLKSYICLLTGSGTYVTIDDANRIIDNSDYSNPKRKRLKELIYTISKRGGIANTLQLVENGTINNLGTVSTIKGYLKIIQNLGINPVVLSRSMDIPLAKTVADPTRNGVRIRRFLINPSDYVHEYLRTTSKELSSVFELSTKEQ